MSIIKALDTRELEEFAQVGKPMAVAANPRPGHASQLHFHFANESRESESADRCRKPLTVHVRSAAQDSTIGALQLKLENVIAETAGAMMILAVHVVRNGAADGDESRTGRHRREPSAGQELVDDFLQQYAGFALEDAARRIESNESIEAARTEQRAFIV